MTSETAAAIDPVCSMAVERDKTSWTFDLDGQKFYFCNPRCLEKFQQSPQTYISARPNLEPDVLGDAVYTCPMHPEVEQFGPGICPKCAMALEPKEASTGSIDYSELHDMQKRFVVGVIFSLPILIIAMTPMYFPSLMAPLPNQDWIELCLSLPVALYCAAPIFYRAWITLLAGQLNMFSLIALGVLASFSLSLYNMLAPAAMAESHHAGLVYFETSCTIITLVLLGQVLELRARKQAGEATAKLLALQPKTALKVEEEREDEAVDIAAIHAGMKLRVRAGERIPVDGLVKEGQSLVDESMMTGEVMAVQKNIGDKVFAGTLNTTGSIIIEASTDARRTVLAQIVELVSQAQRSRAPMQSLADSVAQVFVPVVIAVAVLSFLAWYFLSPQLGIEQGIMAAVAVLVIACPCALGLATPMTVVVAMGKGSEFGLIIKDAAALQKMSQINAICFDKTGTLTEGKAEVFLVQSSPDSNEQEVLTLAAAVEKGSEHPLAQAILRAAAESKCLDLEPGQFKNVPGMGVEAQVDSHRVLAGTKAFLETNLADLGPVSLLSSENGGTPVYVAKDSRLIGIIYIRDRLRAGAKALIQELYKDGLELHILSGDQAEPTTALAEVAGIRKENCHSALSPQAKAQFISSLKAEGKQVAMVGDGINDSIALNAADVGVAMAEASDIALASADITLLHGDLQALNSARYLSKASLLNMKQNLFFAFIYNVLGISLASGLFYPLFGWTLSPMVAALAMSLSSLSVVLNSLRLRSLKLNS